MFAGRAYRLLLLLPHRMGEGVLDRREQVLEHRPLAGLDHDVDRHAGIEPDTLKRRELRLIDVDTSRVVARLRFLVFDAIGRDPDDTAAHRRRRTLTEGEQTDL